MGGRLVAVAVALVLTLAGEREAHSSGQLVVRPLRARAATSKGGPASATRAAAPALPPEAARVLAARVQHWRSLPHFLTGPGTDWSPRASRRRGWRAPVMPLRNPHLPNARSGIEGVSGSAAPGAPHDRGASSARPASSADLSDPPDTIRVAFIRIDFLADRAGDQTTGNGHFDLSTPDSTVPAVDRPPHNRTFYKAHLEALRRYYDVQSYGRTVIEGDVWPRTENGAYSCTDLADFGPWKFSPDIYPAALHMFRTMMFAADSESKAMGDRIPWGDYDRFMIIHAGSDFQSDLRGDSPLDIPSFTIGADDTDRVIFPDSSNRDRPIDRAAIVPETANQDGFYGALNGVIAHENGHNLFGFADIYDVQSGFPVVGLWSLMDSGNLAGSQIALSNGDVIFATGLLPPSVDPFQRFFTTDALDFREVSWGDTMKVLDGERHPDVRRMFLTSDEYLLLENRYLSLAPEDTLELDQDSTTRVVLGPKKPDRFEYDALLPGGGILVWHIDASVIPFETAMRRNADYAFNSNPGRRGMSVIEADGLADLGDPGSPFILGSPLDPYFVSNNPRLDDTTEPDLRPHVKTWPHMRLDFLDDPQAVMRVIPSRSWQLPGWPVAGDFPPGGPQLLAVDADGDRNLEVCWAGGAVGSPDSSALFAVRVNGRGVNDSTSVFAHLDRRPYPVMAALPLGEPGLPGQPATGPAYFAVSTYADGPDLGTPGGRVWLIDRFGNALPGWPANLPSIVTTPPMILGAYPLATIYVGCADGHVYALGLDGGVLASTADALDGGVSGRLAGFVATLPPNAGGSLVAAGGANGGIGVFGLNLCPLCVTSKAVASIAPAGPGSFTTLMMKSIAGTGFDPDLLWISFDGNGRPAGSQPTCVSSPEALVVHDADRLWAFCSNGDPLPGWGRDVGDTIVAGIGAGDPDGDGYLEVLTQTHNSEISYWNQSGYPSPGWPKKPTRENFRTDSPALAVDVDGDGRSEVVTENASGLLVALRADGKQPPGWPLGTGSGAIGAPCAADLDRNGTVEIVAPDRQVPDSLREQANGRFGTLYAYSAPAPLLDGKITTWTMLGGDPGRSSALGLDRTPTGPPASTGPLVKGSLKVYPNPAKRSPVSIAYQLTEPAEVQFSIVDASGHEVASFQRSGRQSDNVAVWDPGSAPAGLYMARVKFKSSGAEHSEVTLIGVLR